MSETPGGRSAVRAHALFGPPRPVLVVCVTGEIGPGDEAALRRGLRTACTLPPAKLRETYGTRRLGGAVVVDLREAVVLGAGVLRVLLEERDRLPGPMRVVIGPGRVVGRLVRALSVAHRFEVYDDLADAVLADVAPGPTEGAG